MGTKRDVEMHEAKLVLEVLACLEEWDADLLAGRDLVAEQRIDTLKGIVDELLTFRREHRMPRYSELLGDLERAQEAQEAQAARPSLKLVE